MNQNTLLIYLTVGELTDLMKSIMPAEIVKEEPKKEKWLVYGLSGLAELLGCSKKHAHTVKESGVIDKAVSQMGRKIVVDAEKALELIQKAKR